MNLSSPPTASQSYNTPLRLPLAFRDSEVTSSDDRHFSPFSSLLSGGAALIEPQRPKPKDPPPQLDVKAMGLAAGGKIGTSFHWHLPCHHSDPFVPPFLMVTSV
jgi:hypothetical protein